MLSCLGTRNRTQKHIYECTNGSLDWVESDSEPDPDPDSDRERDPWLDLDREPWSLPPSQSNDIDFCLEEFNSSIRSPTNRSLLALFTIHGSFSLSFNRRWQNHICNCRSVNPQFSESFAFVASHGYFSATNKINNHVNVFKQPANLPYQRTEYQKP